MPAREIRSSETILIEKHSKGSKMQGLRNLNVVCETQRILQGLWRSQQLLVTTRTDEDGVCRLSESDLRINGGMAGQKSRQLAGELQRLHNAMQIVSLIICKLGHTVDSSLHQHFVATVIELSARGIQIERVKA